MTEHSNQGITPLLSPRYWPTWFGFGLLRLTTWLPYPASMAVGRTIGRFLGSLPLATRQIAQTNIKLCFPDLTKAEQETMLRDHYKSLGMGLIEAAYSWWEADDKVKLSCSLEGLEHLEAARSKGKGVILLGAHFTTMELAGYLLSRYIRFTPMYRDQNNRVADRIIYRGRNRYTHIIHRNDIRSLLKTLRNGLLVWYAADQNYSGKNYAFVPFFGNPAATNTATARIAKTSGAAVVPFSLVRDAEGHYHMSLEPALENFPGDDLVAATARINNVIESQILRAPEQYLWVHRRFKNQPEGMPPVYPKRKK
ncbi:MAG TPA: LpxL/LpxP family Kdo(2)-lipid IV(A) lauroyl/palmitoleoyl acyltransferase [Gammaproteobacteria bacterium]|nr:LpxL/LpxP family Kdo(2)-lipid IV(A) lauroyl/palmitoleoyl acyltransferase [Gammaproteobacteria bacterium]